MMFNKLFWWYEMLMTRRWDAFEMLLFWEVNWDVLRWFEMLLTWVLLLHSWLCRIHFIFEMELMLVEMACIGEFWDEGYALLMPLLISKFLRWEFCSYGTTCICIVLSRIIWLHREVCIDMVNVYYCCNYCWLWDENWWCYMI